MLKLSKDFIDYLLFDTEFKKYFFSKTVFESSSIENINITLKDTITIYETNDITSFKGRYLDEDLKEQKNSIELLNYTLNSLGDKLTLNMLKEMHSILKFRTDWSTKFTSSYGNFKSLPNTIGGTATSQPYEVPIHLQQLLDSYYDNLEILRQNKNMLSSDAIKSKKLNLFSQFHIKFEQIHPFLDGNGRIGRMILIKQSLENDLFPPIISSNKIERFEYYNCLKNENVLELSKLLINYMQEIKYEYDTFINDPNLFIEKNLLSNKGKKDFSLSLDFDIEI